MQRNNEVRPRASDPVKITDAFKQFVNNDRRCHRSPLWDGQTAERIVDAFLGRE